MAVTLSNRRTEFVGTQKCQVFDFTWDSSYPTGGEALSLAGDLGLGRLDKIDAEVHANTTDGMLVKWNGSKTSPKLVAYKAASTAGISQFVHPLTSLATGLSTSAIDILTGYTPGYAFKLLGFGFVTTVAGTGSGASQVFNLEIGTTDVTGGVLTLTLASQATIGTYTAATAITAANTGTSTDTISIEMAASGTVFTAGAGYFVVKIQNLDTLNGLAEVASTTSLSAFSGTIRAYGA